MIGILIGIGFLLTLGIPIASLFFRIVVSLTGGYKIPLAWTFSYYSALTVAFTFAFTFTLTSYLRSVDTTWKNQIKITLFPTFLATCLGFAFGLTLAKAGVLGDPLEDPSHGHVPSVDAIFCAGVGTVSGLGLGLGNGKWVQVLAESGVNFNLALSLFLTITFISISIALYFGLFLWEVASVLFREIIKNCLDHSFVSSLLIKITSS
ncbi:hypothetical protein CFPU101_04240 [Chroococcus sp. FPU101]|nr:hypothetical protein CFPU101_04240 [Chroococcus sp. FPU101]